MNDNYIYTYNTQPTMAIDDAMLAGVIAFMIFFAVLSYAITAFLLGKVFRKAGVPQWAAWVPVYNNWKLLEIGGQQGFWAIFAFIPFANIISLIFLYIAMYHIGRTLHKEGWFVLVAIFLPIVWLIWLGYDDSKWPVAKKLSFKEIAASKSAHKPKKLKKKTK